MHKNRVQPMCGLKSVQLMTLPGFFEPLASCFRCGPQIVTDWSQLDSLDEDSSATLRPWQSKRFRNTSRTNAEAVKTLSCVRRKKQTASSCCIRATIALGNRPSRNCRLRFKSWSKQKSPLWSKRESLPWPKRESLPWPKRESLPWARRESLPWPKRENLSRPKRQNLLEQLGESHQLRERRERKPAGRRDGPGVIFAVSGDPTL